MCTDACRAMTGPVVATRTTVPLQRLRPRWSRRKLLLDMGLGATGVAILAACGSGGGSSSPSTTGAGGPATTSPTTSAADGEAPGDEAADSTVPETSAPETDLRLEHVSLGFVSAYVLARGNEAAIVDTGVAGSGAAIEETLAALGLAPADVRHVVLTHEHGDHVGGLAEMESALTAATVWAGPGDVDNVSTGLPLEEVADGDEVFGLGVVHTPGHTPGSISLFDTDTGLLVAGDAINGDGAGGLLGPNPDFTPDMTTAEASVATLAALTPSIAAFGHGGPPVTDDVASKLAALTG